MLADVLVETQSQRPTAPWYAEGIALAAFGLLYIPLFLLVLYSFVQVDPQSGEISWTLHWFREAVTDSSSLASLRMSLWVAFWSTLISTVLGTLAALGLHRHQFRGKNLIESLIFLPLIMPCIVMGLSFLIWFVFLKITLGSISMILAHITFCLSYVIVTVRARLHSFDETLVEAARDLGANAFQTFRWVTLPLIWPGILSGALMAVTLSFDDFLVSYFTAGVGSDTLPIRLYSMIKFGISPKFNALSTLILFATLVLVGLSFRSMKGPARRK